MGRADNCYDNAFMESCWGSFKRELDIAEYENVAMARKTIAEYVRYYRFDQKHSSLDYNTQHQFETIHPFLDGNGRIGRLMIPLYLVSHGLLAKPSLYLSDFFERNRGSYYDALTRVRASNDLIHWVRFFLAGVAETATKGRDVFQKILRLRTEVETSIRGLGKRVPLAQKALEYLYSKPVATTSELSIALGIATPTANSLIRELMRIGVLFEITGYQRGRVFSFEPYLKLFLS